MLEVMQGFFGLDEKGMLREITVAFSALLEILNAPNSFPCHTSEKPPPKSFVCHTSKNGSP